MIKLKDLINEITADTVAYFAYRTKVKKAINIVDSIRGEQDITSKRGACSNCYYRCPKNIKV